MSATQSNGEQLSFGFEMSDPTLRLIPQYNELKPCPFCGGEPELVTHRTWDRPKRWQWCVRCIDCKTYTTRKSGLAAKESVIEIWNSRSNKANLPTESRINYVHDHFDF
jgi:hypothetical protein